MMHAHGNRTCHVILVIQSSVVDDNLQEFSSHYGTWLDCETVGRLIVAGPATYWPKCVSTRDGLSIDAEALVSSTS